PSLRRRFSAPVRSMVRVGLDMSTPSWSASPEPLVRRRGTVLGSVELARTRAIHEPWGPIRVVGLVGHCAHEDAAQWLAGVAVLAQGARRLGVVELLQQGQQVAAGELEADIGERGLAVV